MAIAAKGRRVASVQGETGLISLEKLKKLDYLYENKSCSPDVAERVHCAVVPSSVATERQTRERKLSDVF